MTEGATQRPSPLVSKLNPPQAGAFEVARTEICEQIFAAGAIKLVLLHAPAGFGKTTVMLQLRRRFVEAGLPCAWLTLDSADNDVGRFLAVLAAALDPLLPGLFNHEADVLTDAPDGRAFEVINRVAAHPGPFALFLDDVELLKSPAVLGLLDRFIEQLPAGAQLIVGSRGTPDLTLGRLRARGRLLEIESDQLRFSIAEADSYLRERRGLALAPQDLLRLHASTEGWAAALWLASVSLERRAEPARFIGGFSGLNVAIVDYLIEDVLAHESVDVRSFLLRTSILSHLSAPLCDVVTRRQDSAQVLRRLEQAHLFLVPLEAEGGWYRYHGMFAQFLRDQLLNCHAEELPTLHRTAADWFLQQGRAVPAIDHALATGDHVYALPLLEAHAQALLAQGRVGLLTRWLDPLSEQGVLKGRPDLQAVHAWAVCFTRGPRAAATLLDTLGSVAAVALRAHLQVIRALCLAMMDRLDEAAPLAMATLESLPDNVPFARDFLEIVLAHFAMIAGRYQDALRLADAARSRQPAHGSSFNFALSEAAEGAVDLTQGRLMKATARLRLAVSTGLKDTSHATNGNAMVGVMLAEALYEADHCEQAEHLLSVYIPLIRRVCIPDQLICAHVVMSRIAAQHGDEDQATQLLTELEHIGHRDGLPRVVASARLERARWLLVRGRTAQARAELDRCGDKMLWARVARVSLRANEVETKDLGMARWAIQGGHANEVIADLRAELDAAERMHRDRRALTLRLVLAQALYRDDQRNKAMRVLAKAVRFAAIEGYVRAFLDEDRLVLTMLRELRGVRTVLLEDGGGSSAEALVDRLLRQMGEGAPAASAVPAGVVAMVPASDLLTRKELQMLRLVGEGLTNDEMAERLFVSETTVRTHLRNINVKLDVRNRMEAVISAKRMGLID